MHALAHVDGVSLGPIQQGLQTFLRGIHIIEYDEAALADVADHVVALAFAEDLPGHAAAITVRFQD